MPLAHILRRLRAALVESCQNAAELGTTVDQLQGEIATRKRTERALRESEERFRAMADTVPVLIVAAAACSSPLGEKERGAGPCSRMIGSMSERAMARS